MVWNVRGLNSRARRNVVRELVSEENISLLSLQETKLDDCPANVVLKTCGADFDFFFQPATNSYGVIRSFSLSAKVTLLQSNETWWLTCVYGPQLDHEKMLFLDELREIRAACPGRWLV